MNYPKLKKTWIFDLDGTIVKHRGYLEDKELVLNGVHDLLNNIPRTDMIIIITGRPKEDKEITNERINVDFSILLDVEKITETKIINIQAKPR